MYYEFIVTHLDAQYLLLAAVITGLIIRITYAAYIKIQLPMRILLSVLLFLFNAIVVVPAVVFLYRWLMICGFYQSEGFFVFESGCSKDVISFNLSLIKYNIING